MEIQQGVYDREVYNFFIINNKFIAEYGKILKPKGIAIYNALKMHANKDGYCFPEQERIAELIGVHRNSIKSGVKKLESLNIIEVIVERKHNGSFRNHAYFLNDPSVWKSVDKSGNNKKTHSQKPCMDTQEQNSAKTKEENDEFTENPFTKIVYDHSQKSCTNNTNSNNTHINKMGTPLEELIKPYLGDTAPTTIEDFLLYWTECDKHGRQRWQKQITWETNKRLKRWKKREEKDNYEKSQQKQFQQVNETPSHRAPFSKRVDSGFSGLGELMKSGFNS